MGRRPLPESTVRVGLLLFEEDWNQLKSIYPNKALTSVVRALIRAHLLRVSKHFAEIADTLPEITITLKESLSE